MKHNQDFQGAQKKKRWSQNIDTLIWEAYDLEKEKKNTLLSKAANIFVISIFFFTSWQLHWNPVRNSYKFPDSFTECIFLSSSVYPYCQCTSTEVPENRISHWFWGNKLAKKMYSWFYLQNNVKRKFSDSFLWLKLFFLKGSFHLNF